MSIPKMMKAMTLTAYDHLKLASVPVPQPGPGEVLCRIKSVAICGSDPKMIHGGYAFTNWPPYYSARALRISRSATASRVRRMSAAASAITASAAITPFA